MPSRLNTPRDHLRWSLHTWPLPNVTPGKINNWIVKLVGVRTQDKLLGEDDRAYKLSHLYDQLIKLTFLFLIKSRGCTQVTRGIGDVPRHRVPFRPSGKLMTPSQTLIWVNQWVVFYFKSLFSRNFRKNLEYFPNILQKLILFNDWLITWLIGINKIISWEFPLDVCYGFCVNFLTNILSTELFIH